MYNRLIKNSVLGPDQRLGDSFGGRRRLLPGVQRHGVGGQRGECSPFDAAAGTNHSEEYSGHQKFTRDPQRPRKHFHFHAGNQSFHDTNLIGDTHLCADF